MEDITWVKKETGWECELQSDYSIWKSFDGHEVRLKCCGHAVVVDWCQTEFEMNMRVKELIQIVSYMTRDRETCA